MQEIGGEKTPQKLTKNRPFFAVKKQTPTFPPLSTHSQTLTHANAHAECTFQPIYDEKLRAPLSFVLIFAVPFDVCDSRAFAQAAGSERREKRESARERAHAEMEAG